MAEAAGQPPLEEVTADRITQAGLWCTDEAINQANSRLPPSPFQLRPGDEIRLSGDTYAVRKVIQGQKCTGEEYRCHATRVTDDKEVTFNLDELVILKLEPTYQMVLAADRTNALDHPIHIPCQQKEDKITVTLTLRQLIRNMAEIEASPLERSIDIGNRLAYLKDQAGEKFSSIINYVVSGRHQNSFIDGNRVSRKNICKQLHDVILKDALPIYAKIYWDNFPHTHFPLLCHSVCTSYFPHRHNSEGRYHYGRHSPSRVTFTNVTKPFHYAQGRLICFVTDCL